MIEKELLSGIKQVDSKFSLNDVPVHTRPVLAVLEIGRKFGLSMPIVVSPHAHNDPDYPKEQEYITNFIYDWYDAMYGDLLKCDFSPGKTIIQISGNLMIMKLPKIFGPAEVFWDVNHTSNKSTTVIINNGSVQVNVINSISGLTLKSAEAVSKEDIANAKNWFVLSMHIYEFFNSFSSNNLIKHAKSDLINSVDFIERQTREYGQSKWSCLQACEKYLKALIQEQGNNFPRNHILQNLGELAGIATQENVNLIQNIQCSPGARYGEEDITATNAYTAHQSVLNLISATSNQWSSR